MLAFLLAATVQITATDYALAMPETIPSGLTTFAFENKGKEPHYVRFVRIGAGHTIDDFVAWQKSGGAIPDWLTTSGGLGTIAPGASEEVSLALEAGTYVAICTYPTPEGEPHLSKGMYAPLRVGPEVSDTKPPAEDLTVRLHDHGFQLTAPMSGGKSLIKVHNNGSEPHQALLVRLPDGATEWNERLWFTNGSRGRRVGVPAGGVVELPPDGDAWFRADLTPGRYILICTILEEEGRHFDLGMIYRFTIE